MTVMTHLCVNTENVKAVAQTSPFVLPEVSVFISRGLCDACSAHGILELHLNYDAFFWTQ